MSEVKAVVFDVGRVLVQWDLRALLRKLHADDDLVAWLAEHVITEDWHFQSDRGRPLAEMIAERIAEFPDHADTIRAYATRFNESVPGPVAGSQELVGELAGNGVPLFAITNFGHEFWAGFRPHWPVFEHFIDIVVSGTEKIAKPDPRIFELAAARFGHAPRQMLFVDDNAANIAAASALGWQVHHFTDADALRRDLFERRLIR